MNKEKIFDTLFVNIYEALIRIDPHSARARTVFATDDKWKLTSGASYDYDTVVRQYLADMCADARPEKVIGEMALSRVEEELERRPVYTVYYTIRLDVGEPVFKQGYFFRIMRDEEPEEAGSGIPAGERAQERMMGFDILLAIRDITEEFRHASSSLDALTEALSEAKREIARRNSFLSLLSSHIRAPLYSIIGLTHIAEEHPEEAAFDDYLHKISMSGSYMQETVDDVLSLRQLAGRSLTLNPAPVHLREFFQNIERMIHPSVYSKRLAFDSDLSNLADLQVMTDERVLRQVVMKMLSSAIGYTARGGQIRLYARTVSGGADTVSLEIFVENRGLVVDRERLEILFKPYEYLRDRPGDEVSDLDLSLVILRGSLLALGCDTITAESDDRLGTRISVRLELPVCGESRKSARDNVFIPDFGGRRVLVVDDNEISLEVSEKLLSGKGIEVLKARTGREAVERFRLEDGRFDLILMDVLMPEMGGVEAARRIRAMEDIPGADTVPIVALTVNAFRQSFEESVEAGMNEHLVKPIDPDSFYRMLLRYL